MATSDGSSTEDWDRQDDTDLADHRERLRPEVDRMDAKYGERPSLLATRADFAEDPAVAEPLLLRAYELAEEGNDARNALYVSHSLADLHVVDRRDAVQGRRWTDRLRRWLLRVDDGWFATEHARLREELGKLEAPSA
jgi:hypothetical protein